MYWSISKRDGCLNITCHGQCELLNRAFIQYIHISCFFFHMAKQVAISPILEYALELCDSRVRGGRVVTRNDWSGAILDCSCWHDDYSHALLAKYPACTIRCLSMQDTSTTGFSIDICIEQHRRTRARFGLPAPGMVIVVCMVAMMVDMAFMLKE